MPRAFREWLRGADNLRSISSVLCANLGRWLPMFRNAEGGGSQGTNMLEGLVLLEATPCIVGSIGPSAGTVPKTRLHASPTSCNPPPPCPLRSSCRRRDWPRSIQCVGFGSAGFARCWRRSTSPTTTPPFLPSTGPPNSNWTLGRSERNWRNISPLSSVGLRITTSHPESSPSSPGISIRSSPASIAT